MILRVRTPDGGNFDVPLGPGPARMKTNHYSITAATVPNMVPVLTLGGNSQKAVSTGDPQAFSIIPKNRR